MNTEQELVWNYLLSHAKGRNNKKTSTEIRDTLNL